MLNEKDEVQELLFRFMRCFDDKDWDAMAACLADCIDCDYSSFRGTPPTQISRDQYVAQRKDALSALKTQHNLSNLSVVVGVKEAEANCNYAILRFHPDFDGSKERFFHSYGRYRFQIVKISSHWVISSITQHLLVNDGNPGLHGAMRR